MCKHTIYLCDITFSKRSSSGLEKELRQRSENYKNMVNKRRELIKVKFSGIKYSDYVGMIEYIPNNLNNDIAESADILVYLYKNTSILSVAYDTCLKLITSFINDNNINSIKLSGDDVERLKNNGIDIVNDIKLRVINKDNFKISISPKKQSSSRYYLI